MATALDRLCPFLVGLLQFKETQPHPNFVQILMFQEKKLLVIGLNCF